MRRIVWFSCGAASAVTSMIVQKEHPDVLPVRIWLAREHADNDRFATDVEKWLGIKLVVLRSEKYNADHVEVIKQTGYVNGPAGARCTTELKKRVRFDFQRIDDEQYFGYTVDEKARADRFRESFPEVRAHFPLIEAGLTKRECGGILEGVGIELPWMYQHGYNNNNCIGCVKGGKGYWNKIRSDFPQTFTDVARAERIAKHSCIKGTFLDELEPDVGRHKDFEISCDFVCDSTVKVLSARQRHVAP